MACYVGQTEVEDLVLIPCLYCVSPVLVAGVNELDNLRSAERLGILLTAGTHPLSPALLSFFSLSLR